MSRLVSLDHCRRLQCFVGKLNARSIETTDMLHLLTSFTSNDPCLCQCIVQFRDACAICQSGNCDVGVDQILLMYLMCL